MPCSTIAWHSVVDRKIVVDTRLLGSTPPQASTPASNPGAVKIHHSAPAASSLYMFALKLPGQSCSHPNTLLSYELTRNASSEHGGSTHQKCQPTGAVEPLGCAHMHTTTASTSTHHHHHVTQAQALAAAQQKDSTGCLAAGWQQELSRPELHAPYSRAHAGWLPKLCALLRCKEQTLHRLLQDTQHCCRCINSFPAKPPGQLQPAAPCGTAAAAAGLGQLEPAHCWCPGLTLLLLLLLLEGLALACCEEALEQHALLLTRRSLSCLLWRRPASASS